MFTKVLRSADELSAKDLIGEVVKDAIQVSMDIYLLLLVQFML